MGHVAGALSGLPIIGPAIGAKAGQVVSDLVFNRLGKTAAAGAAKTADAVSAFLNVAKRATPTLPVAATRILSNAAFGPRGKDEPKDLAGLYKARTSELKARWLGADATRGTRGHGGPARAPQGVVAHPRRSHRDDRRRQARLPVLHHAAQA
jgi:hypothetical protein